MELIIRFKLKIKWIETMRNNGYESKLTIYSNFKKGWKGKPSPPYTSPVIFHHIKFRSMDGNFELIRIPLSSEIWSWKIRKVSSKLVPDKCGALVQRGTVIIRPVMITSRSNFPYGACSTDLSSPVESRKYTLSRVRNIRLQCKQCC